MQCNISFVVGGLLILPYDELMYRRRPQQQDDDEDEDRLGRSL